MTSVNKPDISFVLPTFNRAAYIAEAIGSVIEQKHKNWELLVIDDGSTDSTAILMKYFVNKDSRIKYHKLPKNMGIAYARNYGNKLALADIICIHDSDDLSAPERATLTVNHFKKHPDTDYFYGSYFQCNIFGEPVQQFNAEKADLEKMLVKQYIPHFVGAGKKSTFLEIPYDDAHKVNDDYPLMVKWLKAGKIFRFTNKVIGKYRQLADGVSIVKANEVNKISRETSPEYKTARGI